MSKPKTIEKLTGLANDYGVADNPVIQELMTKYWDLQRMINQMNKQIKADGLTCTKEYVKGRENLVANPLLDIVKKYQDSSAQILNSLTDAIIKFGTTPAKKNRLQAMIAEDDG